MGMQKLLGIVMVVMVGLSACGPRPSASVQSSRNPSYTAVPQKIFVLSRAGRDGELDSRYFETTFVLEASKCGIGSMVRTLHSLDLQPQAHREELERYRPDTLLTVTAESGTKRQGQIVEVVYNATLFSGTSETIIWRGNVSLSMHDGTAEQSGEVLATAIVDQLRIDGVFAGCAPLAAAERQARQAR